MTILAQSVRKDVTASVVRQLLASRVPAGHWEGHLSSSPLSTATAVIVLKLAEGQSELVERGILWLERSQNPDGGFGDTLRSTSNISTTALCWGAFGMAGRRNEVTLRAEAWLSQRAGTLQPGAIAAALAARYGRDRTFSAPILTALAISGRLGSPKEAWRHVPQLPFELAACPHQWFEWLRLPVVSYALPALIAIGMARHRLGPVRAPARWWREATSSRVLRILDQIQPSNGGFLEAVPLTSFVTMSLTAAGLRGHPVAQRGVQFLRAAARDDGSWPIDTNLATWLTTLAINALASDGRLAERLSLPERRGLADWLLAQQHLTEHPYTHAAPGGWAWTDLPGGVPDADDTAGALLALHHLDVGGPRVLGAVQRGTRWLCDLQNSDGGVPTFCRGWNHLPFDRSGADITAHALRAWTAWLPLIGAADLPRVIAARRAALRYLKNTQRPDGSWLPLWFGNQDAPGDENPTYGTARVLVALAGCRDPDFTEMMAGGVASLLSAQHAGGGWGGARGATASIEETALAIDALLCCAQRGPAGASLLTAVRAGLGWLERETQSGTRWTSSPIGFYFAKLWYFEELYPRIFAASAVLRASTISSQ